MILRMRDGDYIPDNMGGLVQLSGTDALLQEVLFRLTARRGAFPFWDTLGSRLWQLGSVPASERSIAAKQYAAEALSELDGLSVTDAVLQEKDGTAYLTVFLSWERQTLRAEVSISLE